MAIEVEIPRRLFTVEEYHRMAEVGILHPHERVELIEDVFPDGASVNEALRALAPVIRRRRRGVRRRRSP